MIAYMSSTMLDSEDRCDHWTHNTVYLSISEITLKSAGNPRSNYNILDDNHDIIAHECK